MAQPAIDCDKLARRYGRRWALADVTFQLAAGRVMMVAGRNGSGKSTLFRVLSTAIRPDHGAGKVGGYDVVDEREDVRRISALLAHQSYLYESLSAKENLDIVARYLGRDNEAEVLERVGLSARADDPVSTFSAGMRKRLSFARVLLLLPGQFQALGAFGVDLRRLAPVRRAGLQGPVDRGIG